MLARRFSTVRNKYNTRRARRESGSVQDALAAGDQKPVLHVAEGFQEHIDSTEEGRAVLREAGFVHIDVSDDIGVASW